MDLRHVPYSCLVLKLERPAPVWQAPNTPAEANAAVQEARSSIDLSTLISGPGGSVPCVPSVPISPSKWGHAALGISTQVPIGKAATGITSKRWSRHAVEAARPIRPETSNQGPPPMCPLPRPSLKRRRDPSPAWGQGKRFD